MQLRFLTALFATIFMAGAAAQGVPGKPLTIIVPYPAGGPSDMAARRLADPLQRELHQPVVVQNIAGATGAIAVDKLLSSPADGNTVLYGSPNEMILVPAMNPAVHYRPDQFSLVGVAVMTPLALVTPSQSPYTSMQVLQEKARSDPHEITYGSVGVGSMQHLAAAKIFSELNVRAVHVPYKGAAPLTQDLLGDHVDVSVMTLTGGTLPQVEAGKLRNLGVLATERVPMAPALATLAETAGLKDVDYSLWGGLFVPAGTPEQAQRRLNDAMQHIVQSPDYRSAVAGSGGQPPPALSLQDCKRHFEHQAAGFDAIARGLAIRTQ